MEYQVWARMYSRRKGKHSTPSSAELHVLLWLFLHVNEWESHNLMMEDQMCDVLCDFLYLEALLFLFTGCARDWDGLTCWPRATFGEVVKIPCPRFFEEFTSTHGKIFFLFFLSLFLNYYYFK